MKTDCCKVCLIRNLRYLKKKLVDVVRDANENFVHEFGHEFIYCPITFKFTVEGCCGGVKVEDKFIINA